jgi:hypothetical protein
MADLREIMPGTTSVTLDHPEFLDGMEMGVAYYFDHGGDLRAHSVKDIGDMIVETMLEEGQEEPGKRASDAFRAGFVFGWIMGLLHPGVAEACEQPSWTHALAVQASRSCRRANEERKGLVRLC